MPHSRRNFLLSSWQSIKILVSQAASRDFQHWRGPLGGGQMSLWPLCDKSPPNLSWKSPGQLLLLENAQKMIYALLVKKRDFQVHFWFFERSELNNFARLLFVTIDKRSCLSVWLSIICRCRRRRSWCKWPLSSLGQLSNTIKSRAATPLPLMLTSWLVPLVTQIMGLEKWQFYCSAVVVFEFNHYWSKPSIFLHTTICFSSVFPKCYSFTVFANFFAKVS